MKKQILSVLVLAVFAFFNLQAFACEEPGCKKVEVSGEGLESVFFEHGTDQTGGQALGESGAQFNASDKKSAFGELNVKGTAMGSSEQNPNDASSWSLGAVNSSVKAKGKHADINIFGSAGQVNFATTETSDTLAGAANLTQSEYEGSESGHGKLTGKGAAVSTGRSETSVVDTSTLKKAEASTKGSSVAFQNLNGNTKAAGEGMAQTGAQMQLPGISAVTSGNGTASYCVGAPNLSAGTLDIKSSSTIKALPNGVTASTSVKSHSSTIGK